MPRLRNAVTGVVVNVSDEKAGRLGSGWVALDQPTAGSTDNGYEAMKVAELRAEIERRNEGRDEAARVSSEGRKPDLVAALKADDAARAGQYGPKPE